MQDVDIVEMIVEEGVDFAPTSAGSLRPLLREAGLVVSHVVPTLETARRAVDAGVDGLIVEGGEGAGFKNPRDVPAMVLLPQVASHVDVPVVVAGGIADGRTMRFIITPTSDRLID